MLSCAKTSLLMFLQNIFYKVLGVSGRNPLLRFDGISCVSQKLDPPVQSYESYEKIFSDLPCEKCYA